MFLHNVHTNIPLYLSSCTCYISPKCWYPCIRLHGIEPQDETYIAQTSSANCFKYALSRILDGRTEDNHESSLGLAGFRAQPVLSTALLKTVDCFLMA